MRQSARRLLLGSVVLALGACGTAPRAPAPIDQGGAASTPAAACGRTVTVQRGDTLSAIAVRCRTTIEALASENSLLSPYTLRAGQSLRMPGPSVYTVRRGDNLYRIALNHGMSTRELARLNGISENTTIHPGQELRVSGSPRQIVAEAPPRQTTGGGATTRPPCHGQPVPPTTTSAAQRGCAPLSSGRCKVRSWPSSAMCRAVASMASASPHGSANRCARPQQGRWSTRVMSCRAMASWC